MKGYRCDECGKFEISHARFILESIFTKSGESNEYHFCSYQCLSKYINKELKKEDRFIYGKGEK